MAFMHHFDGLTRLLGVRTRLRLGLHSDGVVRIHKLARGLLGHVPVRHLVDSTHVQGLIATCTQSLMFLLEIGAPLRLRKRVSDGGHLKLPDALNLASA